MKIDVSFDGHLDFPGFSLGEEHYLLTSPEVGCQNAGTEKSPKKKPWQPVESRSTQETI